MRVQAAATLAAVALVAALPLVLSDARTTELAGVGAYAVALAGIGLLVRQAGRLSLGHGAFMAAGGYTTAVLCAHHGVEALATIPIAAVVAAAVGALAAIPVLRLPGSYLALPTLGLAIAAPRLLVHEGRLTLPDPPGPILHYAISWTIAGVVLASAPRIARSRFARSLRALADNEPAAVTSGVGRAWHTFRVIALSAGAAGIAGSLITLGSGHVAPGSFPPGLSLVLVAAAALGAFGTARGALLGALALQYVPDLVGLERAGRGPWTLAFGVALVAVTVLSPLALALAGPRTRRGG